MSTPDVLAKSAREKLALALNALQNDPNPPEGLLELAEPIAQTMGILHRIERSHGSDLTGREQVQANIRNALDKLQNMPETTAGVDAVMEQIAGCLATVHQLSRAQPVVKAAAAPAANVVANIPPPPAAAPVAPAAPVGPAAPVAPAAPAAPAAPVAHAAPVAMGGTMAMPQAPAGFPAAPAFAPASPPSQPGFPAQSAASAPKANQTVRMNANDVPAVAQARAAAAAQAAAPVAPVQPMPAAPAHHAPAAPQAFAPQAPAAPAFQAPLQQAAPHQAPTPAYAPQAAAAVPKAPPSQQSGNVLVELGTHSTSNFYKGLGGNDVIEHGGIFVATYKIPKMGAQVALRILLPGDYEFQATGVVQWIREASNSGEGADPGFGARFTQITPEGRQLVYRYTRNREPMFYDDL